uniref:Uncharacterized protein n=1 Tax=Xiphophorus maculatus TaxID=8083 RepID=A0A3B5QF53_XIPMA
MPQGQTTSTEARWEPPHVSTCHRLSTPALPPPPPGASLLTPPLCHLVCSSGLRVCVDVCVRQREREREKKHILCRCVRGDLFCWWDASDWFVSRLEQNKESRVSNSNVFKNG